MQSRADIVLAQDVYINSIKKMKVVKEGYNWRQLNEEEKQNFRKIVGQLLWVSSQTRPDIAYDACELSNTYLNAVGEDIQKINKAISKLKNNRLQLRFDISKDLSLLFSVMHHKEIYLEEVVEEHLLYFYATHTVTALPCIGNQGNLKELKTVP